VSDGATEVTTVPRELIGRFASYRTSDDVAAARQLSATLAGLAAGWVGAWAAARRSSLAAVVLSLLAGAFLLRLFVIQHDCGHRSFLRSRRANDVLGFLLGVLTLTPYHQWRRNHALHHAHPCDLDRRGHGDIRLLTTGEYRRLSPLRRGLYRVFRHPGFLFFVAPLWHFVVLQRFPYYSSWSWKRHPRVDPADLGTWRREQISVHATNVLVLGTILVLGQLLGFGTLAIVHLPAAALAATAGVWLFHVQHVFDGARWTRHRSWDLVVASVQGSSYYALPGPLRWITANIGFHHIHHLDSRIPSYHLSRCFADVPELQASPVVTLRDTRRVATLSLWDEERARFVTFRDVRGRPAAPDPRA
jgi:omega-6 fatty acid desaturase (delta-12 desaturase)